MKTSGGVRMALTVALFLCATALLLAQPPIRLWTYQLPPGSYGVTYNQDGKRFAYQLSPSSIVRLDALTLEATDSLAVPPTVSIAYHGNRLYVLMQHDVEDYQLGYILDGDTDIVYTALTIPYRYMASGNTPAWITNEPASVFVFAQQAELCLYTREVRRDAFQYDHYNGSCRFIDTSLHTILGNVGDDIGGISVSADGSYFTYTSSRSGTTRIGGFPDEPYYYTNVRDFSLPYPNTAAAYAIHEGTTPIVSQTSVVATGTRGLAIIDQVLYDMRYLVILPMAKGAPMYIGNLGPNGLMVAIIGDASKRVLGTYDINTAEWTPFDTLAKGPLNTLVSTVYGHSGVMYMYDSKSHEVRKYSMQLRPRVDTAYFVRDVDTVTLFRQLNCSVRLHANIPKVTFRWYADDSLVATTSKCDASLIAAKSGLITMRADMVDTNGVVVLSAIAPRPLVVRRPPDVLMAFKIGSASVLALDIGPECRHLAIGKADTLSVVRLPQSVIDQGATTLTWKKGPGVVGFAGHEDSILWMVGSNGNQFWEWKNSWYLGSLSSDSLRLLRQFMRNRPAYQDQDDHTVVSQMVSVGKVFYNASSRRWLSLVRHYAYGQGQPYEDDAVFGLPLDAPDTTRYYVGAERAAGSGCCYHVEDAYADYGGTLVLSQKDKIVLMDIITRDTSTSITVPPGSIVRSAFIVNNTTIASTAGVFRLGSEWSVPKPLMLNDAIKVVRLPNRYAYFVLRSNADTVGHIVSTITGEIVHTYYQGFGIPTCVVYDSLRRAIHIGDSWGVVSTWSLPAEFATRVEEGVTAGDTPDVRIVPNPTDGVFTIDGMTVDAADIANVSVVSMTGIESKPRPISVRTFSLEGYSPGLYVVVARTRNGVKTQIMIKR